MNKIFCSSLILMFLCACGTRKVAIEQSQNVVFEYDKKQSVNYGDTLSVAFYNVNGVGERTDVSTFHQLKVYGDGIDYDSREQLLYIEKRPEEKDIDELTFVTVLREKGDSVFYSQTLAFNFLGPLNVDLTGETGEKGDSKLPRLRPILKSDGKSGKDASNGEVGGNAKAVRGHIWKEEEMYYVRIEILESGEVWYYQTTQKENILINNSGGKGGDGGSGGNGSRGHKGKKGGSHPGDGGDGGHGGDAGNGGDGAEIEVIVHPNAREVLSTLTVLNKGGQPGEPGEGGKPGKGGKAASGQTKGKDGKTGGDGKAGKTGKAGPKPIIRTESFEFVK